MPAVTLTRHPSSPCAHVRAVDARAERLGDDDLTLLYRVEGDLERLQWPPRKSASAHADGLWKHTCFEAFIRPLDSRAYLELNFSPSTEWAIYRFVDYRRGMQPQPARRPPEIACRRADDAFEITVYAHLDGLFAEPARLDALRLGLAAVLEDRQGALSYWALAHPPGRPDFHHADGFVLALARPGAAA